MPTSLYAVSIPVTAALSGRPVMAVMGMTGFCAHDKMADMNAAMTVRSALLICQAILSRDSMTSRASFMSYPCAAAAAMGAPYMVSTSILRPAFQSRYMLGW